MSGMEKKDSLFYGLFLACFCIYSVSPISYKYKQVPQTESSFNNLNIFVLELILSPLAHQQSQKDGSSSAHVLLLKKRATLSSEKFKITLNSIDTDDISYSPVSHDIDHAVWMAQSHFATQKLQYFTSSGLSPPFTLSTIS